MYFRPFHLPSRAITASLVALASISLASVASAQVQYTAYSENFDTYSAGLTLSDPGNPVARGWNTNDTDTGGVYIYTTGTAPNTVNHLGQIGQTDYVGELGNMALATGDYSAAVGGLFGKDVVPGTVATTGAVVVSHALPTAGSSTVVFSTDYQVTNPTNAYPSHDSFGIALTGTGGASLISINFVPNSTNSRASDNITYTAGAAVGTSTGLAMNLGTNTRYKLTISVNVTTGRFSATFQPEYDPNGNGFDPVTGNPVTGGTPGALYGSAATLVSNQQYAGGNILGYAATWSLADPTTITPANNPLSAGTNNVAHTNAGINALYFDNVLVTVPEPSTYALLGLGVVGMAAAVRSSRRARQS